MKSISTLIFALVLFGCGREKNPSGSRHGDLFDSPDAEQLVPHEEKEPPGSGNGRQALKLPSVIEGAKSLAENLMNAATKRARSPQEGQLYQSMQSALHGAKINVPPHGHDLKACKEDSEVLAFVNLRTPHTIHVCRRAESGDQKQLAQVLTHETAHVVGIHDECAATRVEVSVMRLSGANLGFRNGYMDQCGIK